MVGTNLLKHTDEDKLRNTKVTCLPGAKLRQVANVISTLPHDIEYDKMVVLAGGNDIADTDELHDTVDAYLTVVTEAKKQCGHFHNFKCATETQQHQLHRQDKTVQRTTLPNGGRQQLPLYQSARRISPSIRTHKRRILRRRCASEY